MQMSALFTLFLVFICFIEFVAIISQQRHDIETDKKRETKIALAFLFLFLIVALAMIFLNVETGLSNGKLLLGFALAGGCIGRVTFFIVDVLSKNSFRSLSEKLKLNYNKTILKTFFCLMIHI